MVEVNSTSVDFSRATHTVIVSDLHLCEEEPVHPKFPLWKKYKTRDMFFDNEFWQFLNFVHEACAPDTVELILNGDIFDFDSVTTVPKAPPYRVTWLEKRRGLHPQSEKSCFKMKRILEHHQVWVEAIKQFLARGHRIVFIIGNHDLELHFPEVQETLRQGLGLTPENNHQVRINEWFYISNGDTLVEHGNQYDPYCMAQDPVNPFLQRFNRIEVRVPFGNLATRYLINGMGFFNPHADTNYLMSAQQYLKFFINYIVRAQPLLMVTWLWGATVCLVQSFIDRLRPPVRDPLTIEQRVARIAAKANATPAVVRQLKELFVAPASSYPFLIMQELWLDRAFLMVVMLFIVVQFFLLIKSVFDISVYWMMIPFLLFVPFFVFYSRSVFSTVVEFKEPKERILNLSSLITGVRRVIYGHTHMARHEIIGAVEHLNSGTWSAAFADVECRHPIGKKTFVWILPSSEGPRVAKLQHFSGGTVKDTKGGPSPKNA